MKRPWRPIPASWRLVETTMLAKAWMHRANGVQEYLNPLGARAAPALLNSRPLAAFAQDPGLHVVHVCSIKEYGNGHQPPPHARYPLSGQGTPLVQRVRFSGKPTLDRRRRTRPGAGTLSVLVNGTVRRFTDL